MFAQLSLDTLPHHQGVVTPIRYSGYGEAKKRLGHSLLQAVVVRSNLRPREPIEINYEPLLAAQRLILPTRESAPSFQRR